MIEAIYYENIYLSIVTFFTIFQMYNYYNSSYNVIGKRYARLDYYGLSIFICITIALFIGLRPVSPVFADMGQYYGLFHSYNGHPFHFEWHTRNKIYDNLMEFLSCIRFDPTLYYLLIAFIYFSCILIASRKICPKDTFLVFIMYLGAFSTFSYATNGIKAGVAAAVFLVALPYRYELRKALPLLFISYGLHHSMVVPIAAFFVAIYSKKYTRFYKFWWFSFLIAALKITFFQSLLGDMASDANDERGASYLVVNSSEAPVSGFRPDFILYSAIPLIIGYFAIKRRWINSNFYVFIWSVYTLTNSVFLLCSQGTYINRIAYLSWLMYPFILIYPFLLMKRNQIQFTYLAYTVIGHLSFTLFMNIFYYG